MQPLLSIDSATQTLCYYHDEKLIKEYRISSAANGLGEVLGSEKTPRGHHRIHQKIGAQSPLNTVFVGRQATGEIYSQDMRKLYPGRDWILTRIMWLEGLEPGKNQGGDVDTLSRYIYIHGTPDDVTLGIPGSRGCIRMGNSDIIALFEAVSVGTPVIIR